MERREGAQEDRLSEGWAYVQSKSSKAHYFEVKWTHRFGDALRSLCGEHERKLDAGHWAFGTYPSALTSHEQLIEHVGRDDTKITCARCWNALRRRPRKEVK